MELNVAVLGKGAKSSIKVSEMTFGREFNEALVHQVVVAYKAAARAGTKAQKTRAEVSGGGKKPWAQKGTGQARAGTSRSPLWRKGGVIFAARPRDYTQKVNKQMFRGAMCSILSELVRQNRLMVVEKINVNEPKTRELVGLLKNLGLKEALVVTDDISENLYLAARNISTVDICDVANTDPVSLINYSNVVMTVDTVKKFEDLLA